jgi:hypothetical protein
MLHVGYRVRGYDNMPTVRAAAGVLLCVAALAASGCATGPGEETPAGVNLAGTWKLDAGASDDPQKILAQMRAEALKLMNRQLQARGQEPLPHNGNRGEGPGQADLLQHSPMAHVIMESVARGDILTIRQRPSEFVLDYGTSQRTFTPGAHSVVSAEGGVGDQSSGWKGHEYVIEIKAQSGPAVTESYGLSADGKHLMEKLHIASWELPAVTLTRVYDPTTEIAPRHIPNTD